VVPFRPGQDEAGAEMGATARELADSVHHEAAPQGTDTLIIVNTTQYGVEVYGPATFGYLLSHTASHARRPSNAEKRDLIGRQLTENI
jgi:hypothetical protein